MSRSIVIWEIARADAGIYFRRSEYYFYRLPASSALRRSYIAGISPSDIIHHAWPIIVIFWYIYQCRLGIRSSPVIHFSAGVHRHYFRLPLPSLLFDVTFTMKISFLRCHLRYRRLRCHYSSMPHDADTLFSIFDALILPIFIRCSDGDAFILMPLSGYHRHHFTYLENRSSLVRPIISIGHIISDDESSWLSIEYSIILPIRLRLLFYILDAFCYIADSRIFDTGQESLHHISTRLRLPLFHFHIIVFAYLFTLKLIVTFHCHTVSRWFFASASMPTPLGSRRCHFISSRRRLDFLRFYRYDADAATLMPRAISPLDVHSSLTFRLFSSPTSYWYTPRRSEYRVIQPSVSIPY